MRIGLVLFFVGLSWLGWTKTPHPSQVEIPDWFFHPDSNEYVGVSIPSENASERWSSALASAITNYAAHKAHQKDITSSRVQNQTTFKEWRESRTSVKDTVSYRILRWLVNRNGELFLALNVCSGKDIVQLDFREQQQLHQDGSGSYYRREGVVEWKSGEVGYLLNYAFEDGKTECTVMMHHGASQSSSSVHIEPMQYGTMSLNSTERFGWQYDASPSLHVAYMQAMCVLMANGHIVHGPVSFVDNRLIIHCSVYQTADYE